MELTKATIAQGLWPQIINAATLCMLNVPVCVRAQWIKSFSEPKQPSELFLFYLMKLLFIITAGEKAKSNLEAAMWGSDLFYLGFLSHVHNERQAERDRERGGRWREKKRDSHTSTPELHNRTISALRTSVRNYCEQMAQSFTQLNVKPWNPIHL